MRKHFKTISSLLFLTTILILPYFVFAQASTTPISENSSMLNKLNSVAGNGGYNTGTNAGLMVVIGTIVQAVLSLLGAIFIILMIYAGIVWMTASGNETKVEKAQGMIKTSIIGLIITLSSWAIWSFIFTNFIAK
jgi:hypothetical protein